MGVLLLGPNQKRGFRLIRTSYLMEKMDGLVCPWPICRGGFDTLLVISSTVQSSPPKPSEAGRYKWKANSGFHPSTSIGAYAKGPVQRFITFRMKTF
jgi:hypothetical protein